MMDAPMRGVKEECCAQVGAGASCAALAFCHGAGANAETLAFCHGAGYYEERGLQVNHLVQ